MALGGGTFVVQNKDLPGAYINFVSAASADPALSNRGIATMPLELDWGVDGEVFKVTNGDFQKNSREIFGYEYTDDKLKGLRDLFLNAQTLYAYKLTSGGEKATCVIGTLKVTAKHSGIRGNDLSVSILKNPDGGFDVQVRLGDSLVSEYVGLVNAEALYSVDDPYVVFSSAITEAPAEDIVKVKLPGKDVAVFDKKAGDLQEGIGMVQDGNTIYLSGTLKYVADFEKFAPGDPNLQKGNYIVLDLADNECNNKYSTHKNGEHSKDHDKDDKQLVIKVEPGQTWGIQIDDGTITTLDFSRVTFEQPNDGDGNPVPPIRLGEQLTLTARIWLEGGTNGKVDGNAHQAYLDAIESYTYNTMGVVVEDDVTKGLYTAFNKRLRDEMGIKFQLVVYDKAADYYGIINVKNKILDEGYSPSSLVYWVTGVEAGCAVNRSVQNRIYDGEFTVDVKLTQTQLIQAIKAGEFTLHKVGEDVRVLSDVNSMVTTSDTQGDVFKDNQTIRVIDQIGNDIAVLFNTKYLGVVPNDNAGRTSLWLDIVKHHEQLQEIRAIENFSETDVTIEQGNTKKSVVVSDYVTVVNAMDKLYMTVTVA